MHVPSFLCEFFNPFMLLKRLFTNCAFATIRLNSREAVQKDLIRVSADAVTTNDIIFTTVGFNVEQFELSTYDTANNSRLDRQTSLH
jgi:hypothetical protein